VVGKKLLSSIEVRRLRDRLATSGRCGVARLRLGHLPPGWSCGCGSAEAAERVTVNRDPMWLRERLGSAACRV
jgi:hypothetical protein